MRWVWDGLKQWWRLRLFKKITIHLGGPICNCDEQSLQWSVPDAGLQLECKLCGTKLIVPNKKFVASYDLEKPYPGKPKEVKKEDPKRETNLVNVIQFPTVKKDN
jgi:hypothetical protein